MRTEVQNTLLVAFGLCSSTYTNPNAHITLLARPGKDANNASWLPCCQLTFLFGVMTAYARSLL